MSDSPAQGKIFAKRRMRVRVSLIAALLPTLVVCNAAMAQVSGMVSPTPSMGATSPLGIDNRFDSFPDWNSPWLYRNRITRSQSGPHRNGHNLNAGQRRDMLDPGDFAIGNVRIDRDLRRRRNGSRNRSARYRGNAGNVDLHGNVDIIGNVSDIGNVDNLRDAGNLGLVGNVRLRLKQHCLFIDSYVNVADDAGWRRSNRNSVGIYRDRQSWGQLRGSGTDDERIAHCGQRGAGANDAHCYISAHCFIAHDKHYAGPDHRHHWDHRNVHHSGRLVKQLFIYKRERP